MGLSWAELRGCINTSIIVGKTIIDDVLMHLLGLHFHKTRHEQHLSRNSRRTYIQRPAADPAQKLSTIYTTTKMDFVPLVMNTYSLWHSHAFLNQNESEYVWHLPNVHLESITSDVSDRTRAAAHDILMNAARPLS